MQSLPFATAVVKKLVDAGHIAYFAGGWVRDYLMKHPSDDIDIVTSASVQQTQALFPKTIPVGVAFGIVIVVEDGHQFEVATFRKEEGYVDGRRPTSVKPATPEEDAKRRDFTINGMFWDPLKNELHDYVEGRKDIKLGVVRAIGDPNERFSEDRLRMMRAVRYSTRFNFPIEASTLQAIIARAPTLFPSVAMERVWQEFKKMSQFAHFDRGLVTLHKLNLLPTIFPELKDVSVAEIEKRLSPLAFFPKSAPTIAELLELFPDRDLNQLLALCDYLKLSYREREIVESLHHAKQMLSMPQEWQDKLEKVEWAHFYADTFAELSLGVIAARLPSEKRQHFLHQHQERRQSLHEAVERIRSHRPVVRADHLMKEGISPGKKMGLLLKEAERISVNQDFADPQKIIHLLKNSDLWNN